MDAWQYSRVVYGTGKGQALLSSGQTLDWPQMWEHFDALGTDGWELVAVVAEAKANGGTDRFVFAFKRRLAQPSGTPA